MTTHLLNFSQYEWTLERVDKLALVATDAWLFVNKNEGKLLPGQGKKPRTHVNCQRQQSK